MTVKAGKFGAIDGAALVVSSVVGAGSTMPVRRMSSLRRTTGSSPCTSAYFAASSAYLTDFSVPTAPICAASASVSSVMYVALIHPTRLASSE